jgi:tetratricopeptide (TPR) repeat protein
VDGKAEGGEENGEEEMSATSDGLDDSSTEYGIGREAMADGDYQAAIRHFIASNTAFPHFKTLELLGERYLHIGKPFEALLPLAAAIGLGSNAFRATYLLGRAWAEAGHPREALKHLDRAVEMKPDYKRARELRDRIAAENPRAELGL